MEVACGVDIWSALVDGRVDDEACRVDGLVCAADAVALFIYVHHVRHGEEAKVDAVGVDPERVWPDWVLGVLAICPPD